MDKGGAGERLQSPAEQLLVLAAEGRSAFLRGGHWARVDDALADSFPYTCVWIALILYSVSYWKKRT